MDRLTYRDDEGRARLTNYGMRMYCSTQATADCFAELEESLPRWISVNERLPEDETPVLVWGGRSIYTAVYGNRGGYTNNWWKLNGKPSHYCNPKFWMPLPEPPKEGGTDECSEN